MPPLGERAATTLRYYARRSIYSLPFGGVLQRMATDRAAARSRPEAWDGQLTGAKAAYMKRTFSITARDSLTVSLIELFAPSIATVWDIGCAKGTLARALRPAGCQRYLGVDISPVAVASAAEVCKDEPDAYPRETHFAQGTMGECTPPPSLAGAPVDAVVFNEVLYYLPTARDSADEVARVFQWVAPNGVVSVSMKDDAKSHTIIKALSRRFTFLHSVLMQEQIEYPSYRIRINRQRPAYLVALFARPGSGGSAP